MSKVRAIDLFAGCGGLCEGFEQTEKYDTLACVEWEKAPCDNLEKHLREVWKIEDAADRVLRFDIQRTDELFSGWQNDETYGTGLGLDKLVGEKPLDIIIGGPPCQAYSIAGRVRDEHGMKNDYRNFLFESYIRVVTHFHPKAFVFENVPGILSAQPTGEPIIKIIHKAFDDAGYAVLDNLSDAVIDFSEYGVPQNRNRIIILGLNREYYGDKAEELLHRFYTEVLPSHKVTVKKTVADAIGDLPALMPLDEELRVGRNKYSHTYNQEGTPDYVPNHVPRWHSARDIRIFRMLEDDIASGRNQYVSADALKELYTKETGHTSNVHKYHVLRADQPSNLIPAHLFKDGLRHIHPDPKQSRSITVREAARLQGFPDNYVFVGSAGDTYKMIGNAVPPVFSKVLAESVYDLLFKGDA